MVPSYGSLLPLHSLSQQIFTEHLQCASHCPWYEDYSVDPEESSDLRELTFSCSRDGGKEFENEFVIIFCNRPKMVWEIIFITVDRVNITATIKL